MEPLNIPERRTPERRTLERRPERGRRAAAVLELAESQHLVLSRRQALQAGMQRWHVRAHLRAGRWQQVGRQALVLHTGPLEGTQRSWCALMNTSPYAVLAGLTALQAVGLQGFESRAVHVLVPKSCRPRRPAGVVVHESRRYEPAAVHPVLRPPRTRPARSAVDAALWSPSLTRACAVLAAVVQQRLVRADELLVELARVRRHRYRRTLLLVAHDIAGGSHALSELDFLALCRRARLPLPDRQRVRLDAEGRRRYLDADWDAYGLTVEVDGVPHMQVERWEDDLLRANDVTLGARRVLRFAALTVRARPDVVAGQLRRGLVAGGWREPSGTQRPKRRAA